jgi:hypothetical protein
VSTGDIAVRCSTLNHAFHFLFQQLTFQISFHDLRSLAFYQILPMAAIWEAAIAERILDCIYVTILLAFFVHLV